MQFKEISSFRVILVMRALKQIQHIPATSTAKKNEQKHSENRFLCTEIDILLGEHIWNVLGTRN